MLNKLKKNTCTPSGKTKLSMVAILFIDSDFSICSSGRVKIVMWTPALGRIISDI